MTSSGVLLTSLKIPIGLFGNRFTVFQLDYWKVQLLFMQNLAWAIKSGWSWSGGSTTSADSWIDICGNREGAAVKDDAAVVFYYNL